MTSPPVSNIGVIGGGTMGIGIAFVFAQSGCQVTIAEPDAARGTAALRAIAQRADRLCAADRLSGERAEQLKSAVQTVDAVGGLPTGLDLVVEAVPENLELKHSVLAEAENRDPVLLATNTSALSISRLGTALRRPRDFVGLHFFNPVWSMPLLEIVRGADTADEVVAASCDVGAFVGKETIVVRDIPGFATSRLGVTLGLEAIRMLEDGVASAEDIDRAMVLGYRHPMGPLRLTDLVGLDVRLDIARQLSESLGARFTPPQLLIDKVEVGDCGKKSGRGFFDWSDNQ